MNRIFCASLLLLGLASPVYAQVVDGPVLQGPSGGGGIASTLSTTTFQAGDGDGTTAAYGFTNDASLGLTRKVVDGFESLHLQGGADDYITIGDTGVDFVDIAGAFINIRAGGLSITTDTPQFCNDATTVCGLAIESIGADSGKYTVAFGESSTSGATDAFFDNLYADSVTHRLRVSNNNTPYQTLATFADPFSSFTSLGTLGVGNGGTGATTLAGAGIITGSGTSGRVPYRNAATTVTDSSAFTFDGTTLGTSGLNNTGDTTLGDASGDAVTVNAATVTLNNNASIQTASTKTLTVKTVGAAVLTLQSGSGDTASTNALQILDSQGLVDGEFVTGKTDANLLIRQVAGGASGGAMKVSASLGFLGTTGDRSATQQVACLSDQINATGSQINLVCAWGEGAIGPAQAQTLTIADNGNGATSPTDTTTPSSSIVLVTCNDGNGCNYNPGESGLGSTSLWFLKIINNATNSVVINDAAGTVEVSGLTSKTLAANEGIDCIYTGSIWSCE